MTVDEIIKKLGCDTFGDYAMSCNKCRYKDGCTQLQVIEEVINLVNSQEAQIERLKKDIAEANSIERENELQVLEENKENARTFLQAIQHAKSEAIKEFAMRLKSGVPQETGVIRCADIDNLVKEMTEE